jgi:hypothetical protein
MTIQNQTSNTVYVVSLGAERTSWSGSLTPIEIVTVKDRYFHPIGDGYPKEPPNYLGFRWHGRCSRSDMSKATRFSPIRTSRSLRSRRSSGTATSSTPSVHQSCLRRWSVRGTFSAPPASRPRSTCSSRATPSQRHGTRRARGCRPRAGRRSPRARRHGAAGSEAARTSTRLANGRSGLAPCVSSVRQAAAACSRESRGIPIRGTPDGENPCRLHSAVQAGRRRPHPRRR